MYTVYKIINEQNGREYIGRTKNIRVRKWDHIYTLNINKHKNPILQNDYNNGHSFYFIEVKSCLTELESINMEREMIPYCYYNIKGKKLSKAKREAILDIKKYHPDWDVYI